MMKGKIMALLKGKGAMTGVNLIAKVYDNGGTKDGKSVYADVMVDARDPRGAGQSNLHLRSELDPTTKRYNNGVPYSTSQMEEMVKAAGKNTRPLKDSKDNTVGTVYGFKANVMPATRGTGLAVNTKSLEPSDFKVLVKTLDEQHSAMSEASKAQKAAKAAATAAPEQTAEVETEQVAEAEQPSVG